MSSLNHVVVRCPPLQELGHPRVAASWRWRTVTTQSPAALHSALRVASIKPRSPALGRCSAASGPAGPGEWRGAPRHQTRHTTHTDHRAPLST